MHSVRSAITSLFLTLGLLAGPSWGAEETPANTSPTPPAAQAATSLAQTKTQTTKCLTGAPASPVQNSAATQTQATEAPASFNQKSDDDDPDKCAFDKVENTKDELGPVYNAQSCRECHQNLAVKGRLDQNDNILFDKNADFVLSGTSSQIMEHRAGHLDAAGRFINPTVRLKAHQTPAKITGRNLINDRAICVEAQEHTPEIDRAIQTNRVALNILGDGFVEAIPARSTDPNAPGILDVRDQQCNDDTNIPAAKGICGQAIRVPVLEASQGTGNDGQINPGEIQTKLGRFGWKNQQASLLSFAADAYLNEMGITNDLQPTEVTPLCDIKPGDSKNNNDDTEDHDIVRFARFMRSTDVIPRSIMELRAKSADHPAKLAPSDSQSASVTPAEAMRGEEIFTEIGCAVCHKPTYKTAAADVQSPTTPDLKLFPGANTLKDKEGKELKDLRPEDEERLLNKIIHPYSDFLLHDIGTSDGIPIAACEHWAPYRTRAIAQQQGALQDQILEKVREFEGQAQENSQKARGATTQEARTLRAEVRRLRALVDGLKAVIQHISETDPIFDCAIGESNEVGTVPFYDSPDDPSCDAHVLAELSSEEDKIPTSTEIQCTAKRMRTAPLWGLRLRTRLMHDGASTTIRDAIERHGKKGEAVAVTEQFKLLPTEDQEALIAFLNSL